jgi:hypothetical protein
MKRMRIFILAVFLVSCSRETTIIQHESPVLKVDNIFMQQAKCYNGDTCFTEDMRTLNPPVDSINTVPDLLGGLDPAYPIVAASTHFFKPLNDIQYIYVHSCMTQQYVRYLIYAEGQMQFIQTREDFARLYAPIKSENEALSYAMAVTGYTALFDLEQHPKLNVLAEPLEETFVEKVADGYHVHLFDTSLCGCGPHVIKSVEVYVSTDGSVQEEDPIPAYSDPEMDNLCID